MRNRITHAIAVHGGAATMPRRDLPEALARQYRISLETATERGHDVLKRGGSSLDAVTITVRCLEDDPLFNAGKGADLNCEGAAELDAALMDGKQQRAGAVASVRHVKNPIDLARRVMEKSPHVFLVGSGADAFALEEGLALVPNTYFRTPERLHQLEAEKQGQPLSDLVPFTQGTVGAVALDQEGNLAAATSTGGVVNKHSGRVGDSPIIGAGTYAKNGVCAVSATGHGEYLIRAVAAHHIACAVEYRGLTLQAAVRELLHDVLRGLGGEGGIIAVDKFGNIVIEFTTEGMFRAARDSEGRREVSISRNSGLPLNA
jgi:L-asparaginase / beta-aspartyl-peptidase